MSDVVIEKPKKTRRVFGRRRVEAWGRTWVVEMTAIGVSVRRLHRPRKTTVLLDWNSITNGGGVVVLSSDGHSHRLRFTAAGLEVTDMADKRSCMTSFQRVVDACNGQMELFAGLEARK